MESTNLIAEAFAEAARENHLTAEQQENISNAIRYVIFDLTNGYVGEMPALTHDEYEFMSAANVR